MQRPSATNLRFHRRVEGQRDCVQIHLQQRYRRVRGWLRTQPKTVQWFPAADVRFERRLARRGNRVCCVQSVFSDDRSVRSRDGYAM